MEEQRHFKRVVFREPYQLSTCKGELVGASVAFDLSAGGIRLRTEEFLPKNSQVAVSFRCKDNRILTINGRVAWVQKVPHCDSYQAGLEFDDGEQNFYSRAEIREFVNEHG